MKSFYLSRLCGAMAVLPAFVAGGSAAHADTEPGTTEAQVVPAMTVIKLSDLDFGRIIPGAANGRVTINARNGNRNITAALTGVGTDFNRALFTATGNPNQNVTVSVSSNAIFLSRVGGGGTDMRVRRFRVSREGAGQRSLPRNYSIPADGSMDFAIGARLDVAANQLGGVYTGSFDITVDYQ